MRKLLLMCCAALLAACVYVEPVDEATPQTAAAIRFVQGQVATVGLTEVIVDARSSVGEGVLSFEWTVFRPDTSDAPVDIRPGTMRFLPTMPGLWSIALTVTDENGDVSSTVAEVMASNRAPQAQVKLCSDDLDQLTLTGDSLFVRGATISSVCLDLSESSDPDDHDVAFTWTIDRVPPGSSLPVQTVSGPSLRLNLDVDGTYSGQVTLDDGWGEVTTLELTILRG